MPRIEAGELFILTSGEYSDYGVVALLRAIVQIDLGLLMDEYAKVITKDVTGYDLVRWLAIDKKVAEELPYAEARLGYSWVWGKGQNEDMRVYHYQVGDEQP